MLSLVNPDQLDSEMAERQAIINKIIAAGLNSLVPYINSSADKCEEKRLLDTFVTQSLDKVLPVWNQLDDRIKFFIFKAHISDFEVFISEKNKG